MNSHRSRLASVAAVAIWAARTGDAQPFPDQQEAERRLAAGLKNQKEPAKDIRERALADCRAATQIFHVLGDRRKEATSLGCSGFLNRQLGRTDLAIGDYRAALAAARESGDREIEAKTLSNLGGVQISRHELTEAKHNLHEAALLWKSLGSQRNELGTRVNYCSILDAEGAVDAAADCLRELRPLTDQVGDNPLKMMVLTNLSRTLYNASDYNRTLKYGAEAQALAQSIGDRRSEALAVNVMASTYAKIGELQKAIDLSRAALPILEAIGDDRGRAETYFDLGIEFRRIGDPDTAIDYLERCLRLREETGNKVMAIDAGEALGLAYSATGLGIKAKQAFQKTIELAKAIGDEQRLGGAYSGLADHYLENGNLTAAETYYRQALPLVQTGGARMTLANCLLGLGTAVMAQPREARELLERAMELYVERGDTSGRASTLQQLAVLDLQVGDRASAHRRIDEAIALVEPAWASLRAQEFRAGFLSTLMPLYELKQEVLVRDSNAEDAFDVAERSRTRSLMEMLDTSRLRQTLPAPLAERMRENKAELSGALEKLTRLNARLHQATDVTSLERSIRNLQFEYATLEGEVRQANPAYAELSQAQTLPHQQIQGLLGEDTVLIEFSLGERTSYVWLVTAQECRAFALPPRSKLESLASRAHQALQAGEPETAPVLRELSGLVLGPLAGKLGKRRVAIVADGKLQLIPFTVLADPDNPRRLLIEGHQVIMLPSASVLVSLRRNARPRAPRKLLAAIADPVFEVTDPRLPESASRGVPVPGSRRFRLDRLPSSRREAESILSLARAKGASDAYLGFDATRELLLSKTPGDYRILHMATHGIYDPARPSASGLVFSLFDRAGKPREGFLWVHEFYSMQLNADLVVVSGCQTGLGKEIRGEGLVGMTRGLMYAGAPRIVASLWSVPDRATADLMTLFYQSLLVDGTAPADALRKAQLAMRKRPGMTPYHWASFTYQGDWQWPH